MVVHSFSLTHESRTFFVPTYWYNILILYISYSNFMYLLTGTIYYNMENAGLNIIPTYWYIILTCSHYEFTSFIPTCWYTFFLNPLISSISIHFILSFKQSFCTTMQGHIGISHLEYTSFFFHMSFKIFYWYSSPIQAAIH